jgi:hypothetical protein
MTLNEKIINFMEAIKNAYRSEENQVSLQKMQLNDDNLTEDVVAIVYALNMFMREVTEQEFDIIDFTNLLNKVVVQHLLEQKGDGKHE